MSEQVKAESVSKDEADYEVGFGKPPKSSQFKPGQSGNPAGRRAASGNIWYEARAALAEQVRVREGKVSKKVSNAEAFVRLQVNRALRGEWRAFMWVLRLIAKISKVKPLTDAQEQSGVLMMPFDHFHKSSAERAQEVRNEAARRNDLLARGLPYR